MLLRKGLLAATVSSAWRWPLPPSSRNRSLAAASPAQADPFAPVYVVTSVAHAKHMHRPANRWACASIAPAAHWWW